MEYNCFQAQPIIFKLMHNLRILTRRQKTTNVVLLGTKLKTRFCGYHQQSSGTITLPIYLPNSPLLRHIWLSTVTVSEVHSSHCRLETMKANLRSQNQISLLLRQNLHKVQNMMKKKCMNLLGTMLESKTSCDSLDHFKFYRRLKR